VLQGAIRRLPIEGAQRLIPIRNLPWKALIRDVKRQVEEDNVWNGAAALAFYLVLAIFPALIFLLSVLPYLPIPNLDREIMDLLHRALPGEAAALLESTVQSLLHERQGGLLSLSFLGTIWAASLGMYAIMRQLNITYKVKEARSFIKGRATAMLLTLMFGLLVIGGFALIVLGGLLHDWLAHFMGWSTPLQVAFAALRWALVLLFLLLGFAFVYYFGPNVQQKFRWITPGSVIGTALLIATSLLFRVYIANFANYEATYGSIGAVVILMLWLYAAGAVLLLGSAVNVAIEKHLPGGKQPGEKCLPDDKRRPAAARDGDASATRRLAPSPGT